MQVYSKTDIGSIRHSNQDAVKTGFLENNVVLAIVCDGMGGANAGNVASQTACEHIFEYISRSYHSGLDAQKTERLLNNAIISANDEVYEMSHKDESLKGMGTTVVVALVKENSAVVAHVGDSRAYVIGKQLKPITKDHSVVQNLLERGEITPEDAKVHPRKNVITRALGVEKNLVADSVEVSLKKGERLLLCTDGLSGYAEPKDILETFKNDADKIADELISLAYSCGAVDNITVAIITE